MKVPPEKLRQVYSHPPNYQEWILKEFHYRIDGHKILLQNKNQKQIKIPVNSNSASPIYLCGRRNKTDNSVKIVSIAIYDNHKCIGQIDLKFDNQGNLIPYANNGENSSHYHKFPIGASGQVGRKSRQKSNHHPIDPKYNSLLQKIVDFNKKHIK